MSEARNPDLTRQTILDAAFREIHRRGFQAASLKDILASTGLTKGALYHHFPNKLALGYAVVEETISRMVERDWLEPLAEAEDPLACLQGVLTAFGGQAGPEDLILGCPLNNLALEMSPSDEGFRQRINDIYDRWRHSLARALEWGRDRGCVRADVDPEAAVTFTVSALAGMRSLAKNAQSGELMAQACAAMIDYWESLKPDAKAA